MYSFYPTDKLYDRITGFMSLFPVFGVLIVTGVDFFGSKILDCDYIIDDELAYGVQSLRNITVDVTSQLIKKASFKCIFSAYGYYLTGAGIVSSFTKDKESKLEYAVNEFFGGCIGGTYIAAKKNSLMIKKYLVAREAIIKMKKDGEISYKFTTDGECLESGETDRGELHINELIDLFESMDDGKNHTKEINSIIKSIGKKK